MFFPVGGGRAIAAPGPETTQSTSGDLAVWATGVTRVFLEGALDRAVVVDKEPLLIGELDAGEYEALADAERLETAGAVKRAAADVDDAAATAARADAERLRRERLAAEGALSTIEEAAATLEADVHEQEARNARAVAAEAAARSRSALAAATRPSRRPSTHGKKK